MPAAEPLKAYFESAKSYEPGLAALRAKKAKKAIPNPKAQTRRRTIFEKRNRTRISGNRKEYIPPTITKTNFSKAYKNTESIKDIPMFLVSGHSCICTKDEPLCIGEAIPFEFKVPLKTYIISLAQAGEFACPNEKAYWKLRDELRRYLSMHSESDFNLYNDIGKDTFALFSGIRRAVGGRVVIDASKKLYEDITYPNLNFSFNSWTTVTKGKKKQKILDSRENNPYGVYDMEKIPANFKLQNINSVLSQDPAKDNYPLSEIIRDVYKKLKIRSAIFILGGCLSTCTRIEENTTKNVQEKIERSIIAAGQAIDIANAYYPTLRETYLKTELPLGVHAPLNTGTYSAQAFPQVSEVKSMLKEGLTSAAALRHLPYTIHEENRPTIEEIMKAKFVQNR
jgi:hypothetical protein